MTATSPTKTPRATAAGQPVPAQPARERRIQLNLVTADEVYPVIGSAAGAIALVWVLYERVLPFTGALGFWLCCYGVFLVLYASVTAMRYDRRVVVDRLAAVATASAALFALSVIGGQILYITIQGWPAITHVNFWTQTMQATGQLQPLTSGGVWHAMVGSLEQLGIATALAVPLGVLAALFLAEVGGPLGHLVRVIVTAMTGLPEIVAGLFIYATVILALGTRQDGFAGALALGVMMLPIVTRGSEVMLRLVPGNLREASYALGASQWRTVWNVVLPTARSALTTVSVLGMARAVGETAPLLFTTGFTNFLNANPFHGPQTGLPLVIWAFIRLSPSATMIQRGFGAGLALLLMVLILFTAARVLGGKAPGELTRGQRRRIARDARRS
ncbi:MAG TPA: phosphate ABC transporter permease PstA [Trebonia sp.]|nr:phosphate ABC transporter permease PstA [Trebonia sp.]